MKWDDSCQGPYFIAEELSNLFSNRVYLFADDTNLLYADKDLKSLETVVNTELKNVCEWLNGNKLTININKSNFVQCLQAKTKKN